MRPRLQVPIPEPKGTEYENFDRLTGLIMQAKPAKKEAPKPKRKVSKPKI